MIGHYALTFSCSPSVSLSVALSLSGSLSRSLAHSHFLSHSRSLLRTLFFLTFSLVFWGALNTQHFFSSTPSWRVIPWSWIRFYPLFLSCKSSSVMVLWAYFLCWPVSRIYTPVRSEENQQNKSKYKIQWNLYLNRYWLSHCTSNMAFVPKRT